MNYKKMYLKLADIILEDSIDRTPRNVTTLAYKARQALNEFEIHRSIVNEVKGEELID